MYFHLLMHNSKLIQDRITAELKDQQIFHGQARVLVLLLQNKNISQIELSNGLNIKCSTASRMLKQMEKDNLITRTTDPKDDRVIRLNLSDKGKQKAVKVKSIWDKIKKDLMSWIPKEHQELFHDLLIKIRNNLGGKAPKLNLMDD